MSCEFQASHKLLTIFSDFVYNERNKKVFAEKCTYILLLLLFNINIINLTNDKVATSFKNFIPVPFTKSRLAI